MNKQTKEIIIGLIIGLILGIIIGYFIHNSIARNFLNIKNFQLSESQINEIKSFFDSNPSQEEINNYCNTNRMNCMYYCRTINPDDEFCNSLNLTKFGGRNGISN